MKTLFAILFLLNTQAHSASNDFGASDTARPNINLEKMRWSLEIQGEILVFDKTGQKLKYKTHEGRSWNFGDYKPIVANWSYKQKGLADVALTHEWDLSKDGVLTAKIKQYSSMSRVGSEEPTFGKLLKEKEFVIENFDDISWVVEQTDSRRVVAKFHVMMWSSPDPSDVGRLPINSGRMTIYDNRGNLWASRINNSEGENVFYGVTTHQGSVYISYVPFKGAKEIGTAEKGRIKLDDGITKLTIESDQPFLPKGTLAKVYGFFNLNKRTEKIGSVHSNGGDKEENFLKHINR
ncbi:MAG: hypothetical protein AB7F59_13080 [Bdellovibrionales bacterium]